MPPKRPASPAEAAASRVYISESIHDRNSVFIGYYTSDVTVKSKTLQSRDDVTSASHRVLGWRVPSNQKTLLPNSQPVFRTGHDDDGESWAGKKVEKVLEELGIQGTIMVARWYGGELLGPVRFKHIEDAAKGAVNAWRSEQSGSDAKRSRIDGVPAGSTSTASQTLDPKELAKRRKEVIETLQRRDDSISTLRTLLEQKKDPLPSSAIRTNPSPSRIPDYTQIPFARLLALENARDNTISFLLRSIDEAEAEAGKQRADDEKAARSAKALKAAEEADELEDAWEEMADAMLKTRQDETASK